MSPDDFVSVISKSPLHQNLLRPMPSAPPVIRRVAGDPVQRSPGWGQQPTLQLHLQTLLLTLRASGQPQLAGGLLVHQPRHALSAVQLKLLQHLKLHTSGQCKFNLNLFQCIGSHWKSILFMVIVMWIKERKMKMCEVFTFYLLFPLERFAGVKAVKCFAKLCVPI